jgi:hypothetical protein
MRAHAHLGRKRTAAERAMRATKQRLCPVCGIWKDAAQFQPRKRSRVLNFYCNDCAKSPAKVAGALRVARSPLREHARAIHEFLVRVGSRRIQKGKGVMNMSAEEYAVRLRKFPERVAAVVGKSYAARGDSAELADDECLMRIRDLLDELDDTLIERNKNKKLAKR